MEFKRKSMLDGRFWLEVRGAYRATRYLRGEAVWEGERQYGKGRGIGRGAGSLEQRARGRGKYPTGRTLIPIRRAGSLRDTPSSFKDR
jgi:hypothetical protein